LVDDGIATGGTAVAAITMLRKRRPARIVLAVPVASTQALEALARAVDDTVCITSTPELHAIAAWYERFDQVSDEEVISWLALPERERTQMKVPHMNAIPEYR
jgi:putative phosphoribosyl transferase